MDPAEIARLQRLTTAQRLMASLIIGKARAAGLTPSFMVALAVTESSLNPSAIGDDGRSTGLFQLLTSTAAAWRPGVSQQDLLDANLNADLAMQEMKRLMARYPAHTYGDYAEAWTLGGRGKFELYRSNDGKLQAMQRAIDDLGLHLNLLEVVR